MDKSTLNILLEREIGRGRRTYLDCPGSPSRLDLFHLNHIGYSQLGDQCIPGPATRFMVMDGGGVNVGVWGAQALAMARNGSGQVPTQRPLVRFRREAIPLTPPDTLQRVRQPPAPTKYPTYVPYISTHIYTSPILAVSHSVGRSQLTPRGKSAYQY